jgi:hypothetical protein
VTEEIEVKAGTGSFVVSRVGGRVSAVRPAGSNVLWDSDVMAFPPGDRLWPAPEVEIFYDADGNWRCPPELDPGDWRIRNDRGTVVCEQQALGSYFRREIRTVPVDGWTIPFVAYTTRDIIESRRGWLPWHLVQVPAPSSVFVHATQDAVVYYPPAPDVVDGWTEATGKAERWKLGWRAPSDGRVVLAAVSHDDPGPMVILLSNAMPDGSYVDVPPGGGPATAVQVFDAGGEGFCELEHHACAQEPVLASTVIGAWGTRDERMAHLRRVVEG